MNLRERAVCTLLDPHQAIYHAAHDALGGVTGIAAVFGVNATILTNKINPNYAGNTLDLKTVLMVWQATNDARIPEAFSAYFGGVHVPEADDAEGESSVLMGIGGLNMAMASMVADVANAFADGQITRAEEAIIEADAKRLSAIARSLSALVSKSRRGL